MSNLSATPTDSRPHSDHSLLRVLARGLSKDDITRIGVFLRIGSESLKHQWKLVFTGDAELFLLGGDEPDIRPSPEVMVLRVLAAADRRNHQGALVPPLQYEPVLTALHAVEHGISIRQSMAFHAMPNVCYKLRRWPSSAVLLEQRHHRRLAAFLSAKHITLDDLTLLSNVKRPECEAFLQLLNGMGVLDIKPSTATPPTVQKNQAPTRYASEAQPGMFGKIRRYLGLDQA